MQSDLIKSTPVYRLLKGFSVMKYIRNILVIHLHSLLFINSFFYNRVGIAEKDEREEPKEIVFLSKLLLLFQYCHICFTPNPEVMSSQTGTLLTIETKCSKCEEIFIWKSQPFLLGKFPAGNLLLSFAVLCAGASIKKVLLVFRHMGILVYNEPTYYYHQRHLLIPTVISFWCKYQKKILDSLKGKEVVLAGDGRHNSMGHSAKYGTYTIFSCTVGLIIHIVLVQASNTSLVSPQYNLTGTSSNSNTPAYNITSD